MTGDTGRPAIEPRNQEFGMPTTLSDSEGNTGHGVNRKSCSDPARSKTLRMPGSDLHRSWEISAVPGAIRPGGAGKVDDRNPAIHAVEKSDTPIVPRKPPNNGQPEEAMEGRGVAKGNAGETLAVRTQSRAPASSGLEGIRADAPLSSRHSPAARALCGSSARRDLCGGRGVTPVPTAPRQSWICIAERSKQSKRCQQGKFSIASIQDHYCPVKARIDSVGCTAPHRGFCSRCQETLAARASSRTGTG